MGREVDYISEASAAKYSVVSRTSRPTAGCRIWLSNRRLADIQGLISFWRAHNANAVAALSQQSDVELLYLPEESAFEWWR